jgi:hypothetical protein
MARRCLYYPFIHFRDESWLKLSALYWDDVTRIVPRAYAPRDSRDVKVFEDAGVIARLDPSAYERSVGELFTLLLARHERKLVARYDVARREQWPTNPERFAVKLGRATSSSGLAFIHGSKLEPELVRRLLELRLALPSRDQRWLGMHPSIVSAYMIALSAEIAARRGLSPSSDNPLFQAGISSCSADDLARSLVAELDLAKRRSVKSETGSVRSENPSAERVAFVTLRVVLPERLDGISAKRIVELRKNHAGARHAFHTYVDDLRGKLANASISDVGALDEHVRLEYERRVKPELSDLSRQLRSLGVGSFLGTCGVAMALPVGSLLGSSSTAGWAALAGAAVGVSALAQRQRDAARDALKKSPAAFLFHTRQLAPKSFGARVTDSIRKFTLGV